MPKKKQNAVQKEYQKQHRRVQQLVRRLNKRGYETPENIIPSIPKRITPASVRRLERITSESVRKKSRLIDFETGEIIEPKKAAQYEKQKRKETRQQRNRYKKEQARAKREQYEEDYVDYDASVLRNFENHMTEVFGRNSKLYGYIQNWYRTALAKFGEKELVNALEKAADAGMIPGWETVSDTEILTGKLAWIIEQIDIGKGYKEDFIDELEQFEDWEDYDFGEDF